MTLSKELHDALALANVATSEAYWGVLHALEDAGLKDSPAWRAVIDMNRCRSAEACLLAGTIDPVSYAADVRARREAERAEWQRQRDEAVDAAAAARGSRCLNRPEAVGQAGGE